MAGRSCFLHFGPPVVGGAIYRVFAMGGVAMIGGEKTLVPRGTVLWTGHAGQSPHYRIFSLSGLSKPGLTFPFDLVPLATISGNGDI